MAERISIVYQALVKHEKQADIAKAFRTTQPRVSYLVQQVLKKEGALEEILAQRDQIE